MTGRIESSFNEEEGDFNWEKIEDDTVVVNLIQRIKELSEAQPLSEKKISSELLHKRKGLSLIPAGYLF